MDYFANNIRTEVFVSDIALELNLSTSWFARLFKRSSGGSPYRTLTLMRVERAKELLAGTNLLVKEIASEVGYRNTETFIRAFRSACGLTPGQYRRDLAAAAAESAQRLSVF